MNQDSFYVWLGRHTWNAYVRVEGCDEGLRGYADAMWTIFYRRENPTSRERGCVMTFQELKEYLRTEGQADLPHRFDKERHSDWYSGWRKAFRYALCMAEAVKEVEA